MPTSARSDFAKSFADESQVETAAPVSFRYTTASAMTVTAEVTRSPTSRMASLMVSGL